MTDENKKYALVEGIAKFEIEKNENGGFSVKKDGVICENTKGAMRECAEMINFAYEAKWTTRQFGSKLIKYINEQPK